MSSRGKALIAIISVVILLSAILSAIRFRSDADQDRAADASASAGESTASGLAATQHPRLSTGETAPRNASNPPVDGQTPQAESTARETGTEGEMPGEVIAAPVANVPNSTDREREAKPGTVAAECWGLRGSAPRDFVVTLDREVRTSGAASAVISSLRNSPGYATMFQTAGAAPVRGKRVEFSADIRTRGVTGEANLLLRAEDANGRTVAFDNMQLSYDDDRRPDRLFDRGVRGDTEWSTQHVVVDIPDDAAVITYGMHLERGGKAWIDNARLEVVSSEVATTGIEPVLSPRPLNTIPVDPANLTRSPRNLEFDLEVQAGAAPCN